MSDAYEGTEEISVADIIGSLCSNYSAVYYVDVKTQEVKFLSLGARINCYMGDEYKQKKTMMEYATIYAEKLVLPEWRAKFLHEVDTVNLVEKLADRDYYNFTYLGDKNGKPNYYRMKAAKLNGDINKLVIGFADVDEEVRREEEIKRILEENSKKLEFASSIKNRFLTNVSHELNTPLNAMIGYGTIANMQLKKNPESNEKIVRAIDNINVAAKQMNLLVQSLLEVAEMENTQGVLNESACSVNELVSDLRVLFDKEAEEKSISICVDLSNIEHDNVICDRVKLNRVFVNLIGNAIKYSNRGGYVYLSVVEKCKAEGTSNYTIYIEDNGIGMGPEFVTHIFDIFSRERNLEECGISGTGLGLVIAKKNVEMMKGSIDIQSEKGLGTKAIVSIPLKIA